LGKGKSHPIGRKRYGREKREKGPFIHKQEETLDAELKKKKHELVGQREKKGTLIDKRERSIGGKKRPHREKRGAALKRYAGKRDA